MKYRVLIFTTILLICPATFAQQPGTAPASTDLKERVQQLEDEVKTLRVALLRLQLNWQQTQIAQLESEQQKLQAEKQKAEQNEAGRIIQLQQVTEALASKVMDTDSRAEAESLRASLLNPAPGHKRDALDRREREVTAQLERAQILFRQLLQQAQALGLETTSGQY